ncbi:MAG: M23 family metallopeptidase [Magnetovibrio sp.]|nr:M23 family metallopeptidase [Magnetovibrio sp.]
MRILFLFGPLFGLLFGLLFSPLFIWPAQAAQLSGSFVQGGLVIGEAKPGSRVTLDGTAVSVGANGAFVFGFGRDAKPSSILRITLPDGSVDQQNLAIKAQTYKVQRINGLPKRKVTPDPADTARIKADNSKIWKVRASMTPDTRFLSRFKWPVKGPISGVFGSQRILNGKPKSPHNGVDVAAPRGSTIVAPADGVVVLVHQDMFYTGKTLMIDHGLGLTSVYAHMDRILVVEGQVVEQGHPIGIVGQTGRSTGPHLHWGLTWKGTHLDPMQATGPMPPMPR